MISDDTDRLHIRHALHEVMLRLGISDDELIDDKPNDGQADTLRLARALDSVRE